MNTGFYVDNKLQNTPQSYDIELDVVVRDEQRNETAVLSFTQVRKLIKVTWGWKYVTGKNLKRMLGDTWDLVTDTTGFDFAIRCPGVNTEISIPHAYFKIDKISLKRFGATSDTDLYENVVISFIPK